METRFFLYWNMFYHQCFVINLISCFHNQMSHLIALRQYVLDGFCLFTFSDNLRMYQYLSGKTLGINTIRKAERNETWRVLVKNFERNECQLSFFSLVSKKFKDMPDSCCAIGCANRRKKKSSVKVLRNDFLREECCGLQPSKGKNGQIRWLTQRNYVVSILFQVFTF